MLFADLVAASARALARGHEGLMAKALNAPYEAGGHAGDDDQRIAGNVDVDVLQVVLARAADADEPAEVAAIAVVAIGAGGAMVAMVAIGRADAYSMLYTLAITAAVVPPSVFVGSGSAIVVRRDVDVCHRANMNWLAATSRSAVTRSRHMIAVAAESDGQCGA